MAVKRLAILFVAVLLGAAAPARAWCEATCLAPVAVDGDAAPPHCPAHEPPSDTSSIAAADSPECPVVESARPVVAKLNLKAPSPTVVSHPAQIRPAASADLCTLAPSHLRALASPHLTVTPLRI